MVLGVEKLLIGDMLVSGGTASANRRLAAVDAHAGCASSGLAPDARQLVNRARDEARDYQRNFGEPIPPRTLAERLGGYCHATTLYSSVRPFGAALLLAGYDAEAAAAELYCVEPSGLALRYLGTAVGKGARAAKTEIEKHKLYEASVADVLGRVAKMCVARARRGRRRQRRQRRRGGASDHLSTPLASPPAPLAPRNSLHGVHDEAKDKPFELELAWVCAASGWKFELVPKAAKEAAEAWAKAEIEREEMGGDEE